MKNDHVPLNIAFNSHWPVKMNSKSWHGILHLHCCSSRMSAMPQPQHPLSHPWAFEPVTYLMCPFCPLVLAGVFPGQAGRPRVSFFCDHQAQEWSSHKLFSDCFVTFHGCLSHWTVGSWCQGLCLINFSISRAQFRVWSRMNIYDYY